jgi:hypothetical protein
VPLARGDETLQAVDVRVAAVALVALVAAVVRGWPVLVPVAVTLVGGTYAAQLAVDDAPLDLAAPALAVGLFLAAELAYWSLDERSRFVADPGLGVRRAALVAASGLAIFVASSALLVVVDEVRARGLALDLAGASMWATTPRLRTRSILAIRDTPGRGIAHLRRDLYARKHARHRCGILHAVRVRTGVRAAGRA